MAVNIVLGNDGFVHATVSGDFNFAAARLLLLGVKSYWHNEATGLRVNLFRVERAVSCSIGAMALLAEIAGKNFHLSLEHCSREIHTLFSSGLLDNYFPAESLARCGTCFNGVGKAVPDSACLPVQGRAAA